MIKIQKNGKILAEVMDEDFPLEVIAEVFGPNGQRITKEYKWLLSYNRDAEGKRLKDRPKGMQLS